MKNDPPSIRESQIQAAIYASLFMVSGALVTIILDSDEIHTHNLRTASYGSIAIIAALMLLGVRRFPIPTFKGFVISIQLMMMLGAWFNGGIRRPFSFIEIPFILVSSFLLGRTITWCLCISFIINTCLVAWCEVNGLISSNPIPPNVYLFLVFVSTAFGLYFVAKPLALTRRLLDKARANNEQLSDHKLSLSRMKEVLDARIAEREKDLMALRKRLIHSTEVLSSTYEPIIKRVTVRANYIQDAMPSSAENLSFPVERILAGCERLTRMHQAISRISRLGPEGIIPNDLNAETIRAMIRSLWDEIRLAYPRASHRLFFNELVGCHADPDMLRQVWQHLLSNAAKFSARQHKPRIVVGFKNGEFYVNDNGVGFDVELAKNLFEMFNRHHRSEDFPGDGIGLASAKRIIQIHEGTIRVKSEPGKGTTIFFKFPPPMSSEF